MKKVLLFLLITVVMFSLVACGGNAENASTSEEATSETTTEEVNEAEVTEEKTTEEIAEEIGEVTINVGVWADDSLDELIADFNKIYPNITVEYTKTDINEYHNALLTKMASGADVPDVAMIEVAHIAKFAAKGAFENLLAAPYNAGQYEDEIVSYAWNQGLTTDKKMVGIPTDIAPMTIFYRQDKLNELGYTIADIETMEDWIKVGKEFAEDVDGDGVNDKWLVANASSIFNIYSKSNGTRYFDEEGNVIIDGDNFVKAIEMAKKVRDLGLDGGMGEWNNEWYATFQEGTTLMAPSGAWMGGHIKGWIAPDTKGKWRAANLPSGMYGSMGGSFAGIPKEAKNKKAAWEFIKFISTNEEVQLQNFEIADMFPALTATYDNEMFNAGDVFYGGQKVRKLWKETAVNIPNVITNKHDNIAQDAVNAALTDVLENDIDPKEALTDAKALVEKRARR